MRRRWLTALGLLLAGATSCGGPADAGLERVRRAAARYEQARLRAVARQTQEQRRRQLEAAEAERRDSLWLGGVLREALAVARPHLGAAHFARQFEASDTTQGHATVRLQIGPLLTRQQKHLLVRRESVSKHPKWVNMVRLNCYRIDGQVLKPVLYHEQWDMEYLGDTLRDVNGDGYRDVVVNTYGVSGCCLRAFSMVYLFRSASGHFSPGFEFINPTFSPQEKLIRGLGYGHPGYTELYKYRWRGEAVDTIEYIYYEHTDDGVKTGRVVRTRRPPWGPEPIEKHFLRKVPAEYARIEYYDWFLGNLH